MRRSVTATIVFFKRTSTLTLTTLVLILVILTGFRKDSRKPFKNYVLLVSLDAFRWDYSTLYSTPNLNKMAKEGVKAERLISSFPTVTFPTHYTIATGRSPAHHGLINSRFPAPGLGMFYGIGDKAAVENPACSGGEPIWVTAEKQGVRSASF